MTDLAFDIRDIDAEPYAASPQLTARLQITGPPDTVIHALVLRCQVRIHPQRRGYASGEEPGLMDQFGPRIRWPNTLKPFLWMQCSTVVQGFTGTTEADLPLPCTYDFEVAASKYLHALRAGTIPLEFLFSGTIFTRGSTGFGVEQISWDCEASYELPVAVWRTMLDLYFPGSGWIRLDRPLLDALAHYKAALGLTTMDAAVEGLLAQAGETVP